MTFTPLEKNSRRATKILYSVKSRRDSLTGFKDAVYDIVAKIPKGKVLTYKQVAESSGYPRAYRAVGMLMSRNFNPNIPCHRVIRSDGKIGNYNRGGQSVKIKKLMDEGYFK